MPKDMCAVILAGGQNRRIPAVKGFLELNGKAFIEIQRDALLKLFPRVFISTNNPELYFHLGLEMVGDILPGRGPMSGIMTILKLPYSRYVFVVACDMPFINAILVEHLKAQWSDAWDAVIPMYGGTTQPLCGMYSAAIAGKMERSLLKGKGSIRDFLNEIRVLYIHEEVVRTIDPKGKSFVNINTLEDYKNELGGKKCLV